MSNVGSTVVVTIGRNTKDGELTPEQWRSFSSSVEWALVGIGCTVLLSPRFSVEGPSGNVGIWEDKIEDAAAYVALVPNDHALRHLTWELNEIREQYGQDAIGLITAPGHNNVLNGV